MDEEFFNFESEGWGGGIESPFQVNLWCSFGVNTIETMDSIG